MISLVDSSLVEKLKIKAKDANVQVKGISGVIMANKKTDLVLQSNQNEHVVRSVLVIDNLVLPRQCVNDYMTKLCYEKTKVTIQPYDSSPLLLIGQDNCKLLIPQEIRTIDEQNLVVSRSLLGWAIHGQYQNTKDRSVNMIIKIKESPSQKRSDRREEELNEMVKTYFDMESIGIMHYGNTDPENTRAIEILENTSRYIGGAWEVGLLWKNDDPININSRGNALRRLHLLEKKLDKDSTYAELYYKEIDRLFECGFAEPVNCEQTSNKLWYLPHFGVTNKNKPNRVRLVFDAASKSRGKSFNDQMLGGPDYLKSLVGVLMRFRQYYYAILGDIKDMFMKVNVIDRDRDAQRFLWRGRDRVTEPKEYRMRVLLFGAKCSPATALYVKNKNAAQFAEDDETKRKIIDNCYMDDYLDSCMTPEEASLRVQNVTWVNAKANFHMHSWATNHPPVLEELKTNSCSQLSTSSFLSDKINEKVLGLMWDNLYDQLAFKINFDKIPKEIITGQLKPTKKQFFSVVMSVFDPLGFLLPYTVQSRFIIQLVCESRIKWDEQLKDREFELCKQWFKGLEEINSIRIERCYQLNNNQSRRAQLHVFGDASEKACATVAYWRFELENNQFRVSQIISKGRVNKLKAKSSIPRMELQAALISVRLAETIAREHEFIITDRYFWSDSKTVLFWINKDPRDYKAFVANRLGEIREKTKLADWRYVPTKENPADDGTRFTPDAISNKSRWFLGPSFLQKPENKWPLSNSIDKEIKEDAEQNIKEVRFIALVQTQVPIINIKRFSDWLKLVSTVAKVFLAIDKMKKKDSSSLSQMTRAENYCITMSQSLSFNKELQALKKLGEVTRDSQILKLSPYIDKEGILRAESRVKRVIGAEISLNPIILNAKDKYTQLVIMRYHNRFYHGSHEAVLNEIKQKYYIIGLRQTLRSLVSQCSICKILRAMPIQPRMAALPDARLGYRLRPFSYCGLDYFGPFTVKIGRRQEKRWVALFTCLTVRAIHIELVNTLNADSVIMALRRFSARRATPKIIYSDNGTNFKACVKELKAAVESIDYDKITQFTKSNNIVWRFNPPTASHMGGAWERMIRSVKAALAVTLKTKSIKEEVLLTVLIEAEHCVNSRPLTHVSPDPRDGEALTPNHFLFGTSSGLIQLPLYDERTLCLRKEWKTSQYLADVFWLRWLREYLPTLHPRPKWHNNNQRALKVNDIVLLLENNVPRNQWKKGVITRIHSNRNDDQIRSAEVRTATGNLIRPANKLVKFA